MDLLNLYGRASEWTLEKVGGATAKLDVATPCDKWTVRDLLNHMLETQQFFVSTARNEGGQPPTPKPAELLGDTCRRLRACPRRGSERLQRTRSSRTQAATHPADGIFGPTARRRATRPKIATSTRFAS